VLLARLAQLNPLLNTLVEGWPPVVPQQLAKEVVTAQVPVSWCSTNSCSLHDSGTTHCNKMPLGPVSVVELAIFIDHHGKVHLQCKVLTGVMAHLHLEGVVVGRQAEEASRH